MTHTAGHITESLDLDRLDERHHAEVLHSPKAQGSDILSPLKGGGSY